MSPKIVLPAPSTREIRQSLCVAEKSLGGAIDLILRFGISMGRSNLKRREFLESSLAVIVLAGCGGDTPEIGPGTLRVSRTDVYAEDLNGLLYRATPSANVVAAGTPVWTTGSLGSEPGQFGSAGCRVDRDMQGSLEHEARVDGA